MAQKGDSKSFSRQKILRKESKKQKGILYHMSGCIISC
jgi:hypothetical protein